MSQWNLDRDQDKTDITVACLSPVGLLECYCVHLNIRGRNCGKKGPPDDLKQVGVNRLLAFWSSINASLDETCFLLRNKITIWQDDLTRSHNMCGKSEGFSKALSTPSKSKEGKVNSRNLLKWVTLIELRWLNSLHNCRKVNITHPGCSSVCRPAESDKTYRNSGKLVRMNKQVQVQ